MSNIDRQCCNWISCSKCDPFRTISVCRINSNKKFSSYDSNFLPRTFQNSLDEFPSMHFLLSNTIQSPKTNCIKNSLEVFWASEVQQLHTITFRRELNREQYSSNYSHAQKQLLWDIADRTPRPVKHALKPVDIAIQYHIDKEIEGSRFLSDVSFQGNSFHSPIASNDANASSS